MKGKTNKLLNKIAECDARLATLRGTRDVSEVAEQSVLLAMRNARSSEVVKRANLGRDKAALRAVMSGAIHG